MMFSDIDLEQAWQDTLENHDSFLGSSTIRCLSCGKFLHRADLKWRPRINGECGEISATPISQASALCPTCNTSSVISDRTEIALLHPQLPAAMAEYMKKMGYAFD